MKHFLLIVFSILLIGCSDDDGGTTTTPNSVDLIGTWKSVVHTDLDGNVYDTTDCENTTNTSAYRQFMFRENLSFNLSNHCNGEVGSEGTYAYDNNILKFQFSAPDIFTTSVEKITDDQIHIEIEGLGHYIMLRQ